MGVLRPATKSNALRVVLASKACCGILKEMLRQVIRGLQGSVTPRTSFLSSIARGGLYSPVSIPFSATRMEVQQRHFPSKYTVLKDSASRVSRSGGRPRVLTVLGTRLPNTTSAPPTAGLITSQLNIGLDSGNALRCRTLIPNLELSASLSFAH
jgi:hypothetical protein